MAPKELGYLLGLILPDLGRTESSGVCLCSPQSYCGTKIHGSGDIRFNGGFLKSLLVSHLRFNNSAGVFSPNSCWIILRERADYAAR